MQRDHEQLQKVINSLTELGVKITKTKSRLEIAKVLDEVKSMPGYSEFHS